jgi:hypothetical protein
MRAMAAAPAVWPILLLLLCVSPLSAGLAGRHFDKDGWVYGGPFPALPDPFAPAGPWVVESPADTASEGPTTLKKKE